MRIFMSLLVVFGHCFSVHDFCPKVCVACSPHLLGKRSIDFDELADSEKFDEPENFSKRGWFANLFTGYQPKREVIDKREPMNKIQMHRWCGVCSKDCGL